MNAPEPRFELLRLAAEEVAEGVAVVELEGRWDGRAPEAGDARLVAGDAESAPLSCVDRDGRLQATFALPAAAAAQPLVLAADGVRVRLPEPHGTRDDRLAALARELNEVRHERDALRAEVQRLRGRGRRAPAGRPAIPPGTEPPAPVVVHETPVQGIYYALAGLGVVGFLLVLVLLL